MCHPIGFGFERLDSKIGYMHRISSDITGGDSSFFFREDGERGWRAIICVQTLITRDCKGVGGYFFKYFPQSGAGAITRGRRLIEGRVLVEEMLHTWLID